MAYKNLGLALMNIGRELPETLFKRQELLNEKGLKNAQLEANRIEEERQRLLQEAKEQRETTTFGQQQEEYQRKKAEQEEAGNIFKTYQEGLGAPDTTRYSLGVKTGLPRAAAILPQAKGEWETVVAEEKARIEAQKAAEKAEKIKRDEDFRERALSKRTAGQSSDYNPFGLSPEQNTEAYVLAKELGTYRGMDKVYPSIATMLRDGKSPEEIRKNIKEKVGKQLPASNAERLGEFDGARNQMTQLLEAINDPTTPQGPIMQWKKANPWNWKAQGKKQIVAATKQLVGKALEGGVLRKEDEIKYNAILPAMGDSYNSAIIKAKQLNSMLDVAYKAKIDAYRSAGWDVSAFKSDDETGASKFEIIEVK
jgi:hypothetical protein